MRNHIFSIFTDRPALKGEAGITVYKKIPPASDQGGRKDLGIRSSVQVVGETTDYACSRFLVGEQVS
jgi:hypothetical protein